MPNVIVEHIAVTPGVCGGQPRVARSRVRVQDVVVPHEWGGRTSDEIVAAYPGLTLADVHAALAYYYDHRDEVRRALAEDEALAAAMRAATPSKVATGSAGGGGSAASSRSPNEPDRC